MRAPSRRLSAVLAVLVSAAVGAVTNLITNRWSWTLAAVLAVLLTASAGLAAQAAGTRRGERIKIRQEATRGARIHRSAIRAASANVTQAADRKGAITRSPIDTRGADITQTAAHADITDSPIEADYCSGRPSNARSLETPHPADVDAPSSRQERNPS